MVENINTRISPPEPFGGARVPGDHSDQANVGFKAMLLYAVVNHDEETIKNVAFKFIDERSLMIALTRTVEGSVRSFVPPRSRRRS